MDGMHYILKIMIFHVVVSTWGNDKEYWSESATSLAVMYFLCKEHHLYIKDKKLE